MFIEIDAESDEALYLQLKNQIILAIAANAVSEGDMLPSVRSLAAIAGVNMHTVNKAYALLQTEGFLTIGRRGTMISVNDDRERALRSLRGDLSVALAKARCRSVSRDDVHRLIDDILSDYDRNS